MSDKRFFHFCHLSLCGIKINFKSKFWNDRPNKWKSSDCEFRKISCIPMNGWENCTHFIHIYRKYTQEWTQYVRLLSEKESLSKISEIRTIKSYLQRVVYERLIHFDFVVAHFPVCAEIYFHRLADAFTIHINTSVYTAGNMMTKMTHECNSHNYFRRFFSCAFFSFHFRSNVCFVAVY